MKKNKPVRSQAFHFIIAVLTALLFSVGVSLALPVNPMWIAGGLVAIYIAQLAGMFAFTKGSIVKRGQMLMALTAYAPCTEDLGTHTPAGDCIAEGSGILGLMLIKKGFNIATLTTQELFDAAVSAENIIIIKDIEAYWAKPTEQTIAGIAGRVERLGHWLYDMPFKHEGVDANLHFWNTINHSRNYGAAVITEEYKAFGWLDRDLEPVLCHIIAAPDSDQEFGKTRFFSGNVKCKSKDLVQHIEGLTSTILKGSYQV